MVRARPSLLGPLLALACCGDGPSNDPRSGCQPWLTTVHAPEAWTLTRDAPSGLVAVLDNGVDVSHEDLADALWRNPAETPGNGRDDDNNGFVDDVFGVDLRAHSGDVSLRAVGSSPEHATAVAGIIAARTNNALGVASVCPRCRVMVLRGRDFSTHTTTVDLLESAVTYAADHGARVLNVSDGVLPSRLTDALRASMERAAADAERRGVLIVASAGNDGDGVRWPAAIPSVLAVAAVDDESAPASFSGRGPAVDLAAPGVELLTTVPGGYGDFSGTSASAPVVAAVAAMLVARHPTWTPAEVIARLTSTARPIAATGFGAGVVDAQRALSE